MVLRNTDIKNVSFRKAFVGGYRPEDVDAFVDSVQASFEELLCENNNLIMTVRKMEQELRKFYSEESSIRSVIHNLKNVTDKSILDAESQARTIISNATKTSEEMINKAKKEVSMAKKEVSVQEEISKSLKNESSKLKQSLESIYAQHMRFLNQLPSFAESKVESKEQSCSNESFTESEQSTPNADTYQKKYKDKQKEDDEITHNFGENVKQNESYNKEHIFGTDSSSTSNRENFCDDSEFSYTTNNDIPSYHKDQEHTYNPPDYNANMQRGKNKAESDKPLKFNILDIKAAGGSGNSKYDGLHFGSKYKSTSILDLLRGKR